MNELLLKVIYILLIFLPCLGSPMTIYFIDEVLRYRLKHRRALYIFSFITAFIAGVFFTIAGGYYGEVKEAIIITDLPAILLSLFMMLIVGFNIQEKWWKRIAVVFLATGMITNISSIFAGLREEINLIGITNNRVVLSIRYLMYEVLALLLEFLFFVVIARIRRKKDDVPLPMTVLLAMYFILTIFASLLPGDYTDSNFLRSSSPSTIAMMLSALAFVTLMFYVRVTRKERNDLVELNARNEEYIAAEARYFELSAESDTKIRSMRHDMRNNLQVLSLLLESGEYDKMREYLDELGADLSSADISPHTGDLIADAIISEKKRKAAAAGAVLNVSGVITGVRFAPVDMCKILGNMLDNAIEAVSDERLSGLDEDQKVIDLVFKKTDRFFMMSMTNPCAECPEITDGLISTGKSDTMNHGFGLKNIRDASETYGGELSLSCEERSHVCKFRTEIIFNLPDEVTSDAPNL